MAHRPHRRHGNFPQRRATLLPRVTKRREQLTMESSETGSNPTCTAEAPSLQAEHLCSTGVCEVEESKRSCNGKTGERQPGKDVLALAKRIRIHPETRRILGNSCMPVMRLERLNLQFLSCLQPVVSLVRLPRQTQAQLRNDAACWDRPRQNGFSQHEENILEKREVISQQETTSSSWTEPYCPDSSPSGEPERDSGFDCDSNPDQMYILFDSGSDEWDPDGKTDSETFYLDPDPEQTMVIELDPEEPDADPDQFLELEDEAETKCEVVQMDDSEDQGADLCCSQEEEEQEEEEEEEEEDSSMQKPGSGSRAEEMESEDFCAVCLNGGELLCCDRCPKVYHLVCHIPPPTSFPLGDWVCTLCRTDQEPVESYDCENRPSCGGATAPYTLCPQDQRRCEKMSLLLYCHALSAPFHEPVSVLARHYYQIIKRPIDLSVIRRKLDKSNTLHYFTAEQLVDDVLLMFKNCTRFNYPDSEVAQAGRSLEVFFLSKLKEIFPERTFPSANHERTDTARPRWLCRKRKEDHRKRRHVFSGKKYYL